MPRLSERYGRAAITLHWTVAALIAASFVLAWVLPRKTAPGYDAILQWHKSVGLVVLAVVLLRLLWRQLNPVAPESSLTPLEARLSSLTHGLLYVTMIAIPLTGYLFSSAEGQSLSFFGLISAAPPLATDRVFSRPVEFIHKTGQYAVYFLVGLHVLAALYHHFVKRDGVLRRMLPLASSAGD